MKIYLLSILMLILSSCSLIQFGTYNPPSKVETLSNSSFRWQKDSTKHFNFYYDSRFIPNGYVDSAKVIFEKEYPELLRFLGVKKYKEKLNLFMVDSRKDMGKLIGMETNGIASPKDNTVYSIFNANVKTYGKHEFCHVISINEWGMYKEVWLSEGLAVNSDDNWWGYDLHSLANYLYSKNKLIPIKEIIKNFHKYESLITYPECGSFVKYIKDKYGLALVKELWKDGATVFEKRLDKNISSIEQEWLQEIKKHNYTNIDYGKKVFAKFGTKL